MFKEFDRVILTDGRRGVIRGVWLIPPEYNIRLDGGGNATTHISGIQGRETFLQFITRRTGFGLTSWREFGWIAAGIAACITGGIVFPETEAKWTCYGFAALITTWLMWGTVRNFHGKQG